MSGAQGNQELLRRIADTASANNLGAHRKGFLPVKGEGRLDLYESGATLVVSGQVRAVRYDSAQVWQQITRVQQNGVHTHTKHEYRITDVRGAELRLDESISGPDEWGPALVEAVAVRQAPVAVETLQAGQRVEFGPWWLSATQFGGGSKTFALTELRAFRVDQGQVYVEAGDSTRLVKGIGEIPNFLVFRFLLKQLLPELPESAGKTFDRRLTVRGLNRLFAVIAVVAFGIACVSAWPVGEDELCDKLSALRSASSEITDQLKDLKGAADDYRGADQEAIRADGDKLGELTDGSGWQWIKDSELNAATTSIRPLCRASEFSF
ncbi:DUF6585 family protein [Nocardia crassostreae]|uniref:DUF6585 family protein n=1 Tax=Nocardia crassostreae TaxID=53428 RepID=UPI00082C5599|nr:DUF6585 family protein [Nocardia crassostreae]